MFRLSSFGLIGVFSLTSFWWSSKVKKNVILNLNQPSHLPLYTFDFVKNNHGKNSKNGYWVIYKNKVYDITEFVDSHPGGKIIFKAVGGHLDPYFEIYTFHNNKDTFDFLDSMLVGRVSEEETYDQMKELICDKNKPLDPFESEPDRDPALVTMSKRPFNAETPPVLLNEAFHTPSKIFYVRNHLPVPLISDSFHSFQLCFHENFVNKSEIDEVKKYIEIKDNESRGVIGKSITKGNNYYKTSCLTGYFNKDKSGSKLLCRDIYLSDMEEMYCKHKVNVAIQCAGNRRIEMNKIAPVNGLQWSGGAIGNAEWSGYRLRDVILNDEILKMDEKYPNDLNAHVKFMGHDFDVDSESIHFPDISVKSYLPIKETHHPIGDEHYEASIRIEKAIDPDTIIATEMNGSELSRDHGYPMRVIVPGITGARNVKWLKRITVSPNESDSRWQKDDYKVFPSNVKFGEKVDVDQYLPIQGTPVTSLICQPKNNSHLDKEDLKNGLNISGYAYSGNGSAIIRVDVSVDGGKTWLNANIKNICENKARCWSWTLWDIKVDPNLIKSSKNEIVLLCRAVDANHNTQPESLESLWNMRGLLNNSWSKTVINY